MNNPPCPAVMRWPAREREGIETRPTRTRAIVLTTCLLQFIGCMKMLNDNFGGAVRVTKWGWTAMFVLLIIQYELHMFMFVTFALKLKRPAPCSIGTTRPSNSLHLKNTVSLCQLFYSTLIGVTLNRNGTLIAYDLAIVCCSKRTNEKKQRLCYAIETRFNVCI